MKIVISFLHHRKYRGHTTRSELYGYRNGNKIEALELCMVPAGEEHTIGPRQVRHIKLTNYHTFVNISSARNH